MKINKRNVDLLEPRPRFYEVWDDELLGFGVKVHPSGTKVYQIRYRSDGSQRFYKLGPHGPLTPDMARKQAKIRLGEIALGEDPQEERRTRRKSMTVADLCDEYLAACQAGKVLGKGRRPKRASTIATDIGRIERHIKPVLGQMLVISLRRKDVVDFMNDVIDGKTAVSKPSGKLRGVTHVTGGHGTAARTTGLLGGILSYAVEIGIRDDNPARGVRRPADNKRRRRLTNEELGSLGDVLRAAKDQHPAHIMFTRLALLTGWRKSSLEQLDWSQLDQQNRVAFVEDKGSSTLRPIGQSAVNLLSAWVEGDWPRHGFVLPALREGGQHYASGYKALTRLAERAGIEDVTPHTARHTLISKSIELGISQAIAAVIVGQKSGHSVTDDYAHILPEYLISAADLVGNEIDRLLGYSSAPR